MVSASWKLVALCICLVGFVSALVDRPVIGIVTEPAPDDFLKFGPAYIPASYVKFFEAGGAKIVPIPYTLPEDQLRAMFNSVNGAVFIGGDADINDTQYFNASRSIMNWAIEEFQQGGYFPIWGTCLGFELICVAATNDINILGDFDAENIALPLNFTSFATNSRLLSLAQKDVIIALSTENITINWHEHGVETFKFTSNPALASLFNVVSTNVDRNGKEFVSLFEGKQYPIYASQFHPERNQFEFDESEELLRHSRGAVISAGYLSSFFVEEARKSNHTFAPDALKKALIYNYLPVYTAGVADPFYEQTYFFQL